MTLDVAKLRYKAFKGKRYCVCMKNTNVVRCWRDSLYYLAYEMFGFGMDGTNVYAYDLKEGRVIEPKDYEIEMKEVIEYQKKKGWL